MNRKTWKRGVLALVVIYVMIVASGVYIWPNREPFVAETPVGDGSQRLRLLRIGPGPLMYSWSDPRPRWLQLITPRLIRKSCAPVKLELDGMTRFRMPSSHIIDESPASHLLMRFVDRKGEYTDGVNFRFPRVELVDSAGFAFLPAPLEFARHAAGTLCAERTAVPRRDRRLTVRIGDRDVANVPIEFSIDNPFFNDNVATWEGGALPQSVVLDHSKLTLKSIDLNVLGLTALVDWEGIDWRLESFSTWFEDATGNRGLWLSPDEPAWKVHLTALPVNFSTLPAESTAQLSPIRPPAEGQSIPLNQSLKLAGTTIEVRELRTTIKQAAGHEPKPAWAGQLVLEIHISAKKQITPIFARAINADGTKTREVTGLGGGTDNEWTYQFLFPRPEGDRPLAVELGIGTPRDVSFLVAPPKELKERMLEFIEVTRTGKWDPEVDESSTDDAPKAAPAGPGLQMPPRPMRSGEKT